MAVLLILPSIANAQDHATARKMVSNCVKWVREFSDDDPMYYPFYRRFDAFYNESAGTVENNAYAAGDQRALFQFRKCMAHNGMPLGPSKLNNQKQ